MVTRGRGAVLVPQFKPARKVLQVQTMLLLAFAVSMQSPFVFADSIGSNSGSCPPSNTESHSSNAEPSSPSSSVSGPSTNSSTSSSAKTDQSTEGNAQEAEEDDTDDNTPKWDKPLAEGSETMFYFVEAVSGKKLKPVTSNLLRGVTDITIEAKRIVFRRSDNAELPISSDSTGGAKFYRDWEKSKINLEDKFGKPGMQFLESVQSVRLNGDRVEIVRTGPEELVVQLGARKLHDAFDLRGLKLRQIGMLIDHSGEFPFLKDITGVTAVIKAPGFSFPVEVKEFSKVRLKKENDITVGVRNPVPGPLRAILFLPSLFHFHFRIERKV